MGETGSTRGNSLILLIAADGRGSNVYKKLLPLLDGASWGRFAGRGSAQVPKIKGRVGENTQKSEIQTNKTLVPSSRRACTNTQETRATDLSSFTCTYAQELFPQTAIPFTPYARNTLEAVTGAGRLAWCQSLFLYPTPQFDVRWRCKHISIYQYPLTPPIRVSKTRRPRR